MVNLIQPRSGTYLSSDVTFLLEDSSAPSLSIQEKEAAIQSGAMHYSECITVEDAPSPQYLKYYESALNRSGARFAQDMVNLSHAVLSDFKKDKPVILVSLARAGTPIGVLMQRYAVKNGFDSTHYSVSIVRDKGLDLCAIQEICWNHSDLSQLIFVDGWTGKGTITRELNKSIDLWNFKNKYQKIDCKLAVIADPCGWATYSATHDDYLVPNAILNSTISGCVSRTTCMDNNKMHGAKFFESLVPVDMSNIFVDCVEGLMDKMTFINIDNDLSCKKSLQVSGRRWFDEAKKTFGAKSDNHLKPGIPEATRVLLRRVPRAIIVRDIKDKDVDHLIFLAREKNVELRIEKDMPYAAVGLIDGNVGD